eukprot:scaffold45667_cov20-Tisochrysis_lutea.AAC.1
MAKGLVACSARTVAAQAAGDQVHFLSTRIRSPAEHSEASTFEGVLQIPGRHKKQETCCRNESPSKPVGYSSPLPCFAETRSTQGEDEKLLESLLFRDA